MTEVSTVSSFVTPKLRELTARVALRRVRSLLRLVGGLYGTNHIAHIRSDLREVAQATGSLRDEEVLGNTLRSLNLESDTKNSLERWLKHREAHQKELHQHIVNLLVEHRLEIPLRVLDALLILPVHSRQDRNLERFARKMVLLAQENVEKRRHALVDDVVGLHNLRLRYKRLRYTIENFRPVLAPELVVMQEVATLFQKRLGDVHDVDVALEIIENDRKLDRTTKQNIADRLQEERLRITTKYLHERYHGVPVRYSLPAPAPVAAVEVEIPLPPPLPLAGILPGMGLPNGAEQPKNARPSKSARTTNKTNHNSSRKSSASTKRTNSKQSSKSNGKSGTTHHADSSNTGAKRTRTSKSPQASTRSSSKRSGKRASSKKSLSKAFQNT
jgi:CHAD domain-containing protein